jgi:hypothetical protein
MTTQAPPAFTAWRRPAPGRPWRKVLDAATEADVRDRLLDLRLGGDSVVLRAGEDPNRPARKYHRGRRML